jgi:diguanylate cyclase (GGDEF)-like protein
MFWGKKGGKKQPDESPASAAEPAPASGDDPGLDAAADLLRILGKFAFDIDQYSAQTINDLCQQWARHVLIAAPYPGSEQGDASARSTSGAVGDRNWQGLRDFVTQLRQREKAYVTTNFKEIRNVLGDFIDTLGKVISEGQEDQTDIGEQLNRLRYVVESNASLDTVKREAMQVIGTIGHITEERQRAHRDTLEQLADKIKSMREELSAAKRELDIDALTRLYNRKAFDQQLLRIFDFNKLSGQPCCLLMADLDHFKKINDNHGHLVGDLVLRKFADCCAQTFPRRSDFVARYGGEEFVIIAQETTVEVAAMLAERLLQAVRGMRVVHEGREVRVTVSVGIAELDPRHQLPDWIGQADSALYRAKQGGRDRFAL